MATNLQPLSPPINTPLVDKNGMVTSAWADFYLVCYRYQLVIHEAFTDGTYTLGLGSTDGKITIVNGIVTNVQEVVA